jgi:hypothetical protein
LRVESTITRPFSSRGSPKSPTVGVGLDPGGPDQRVRFDALAVGEGRGLGIQGVKGRLEPQGVLGEAGHGEDARDRPERDDEVRVLELDAAGVGLDGDGPRALIEADGLAQDEARVGAHHP